MTQRQLDLRIPTYEPNTVPIGKRHIVEIRNKGKSIGIYTLSRVNNKKRGVSLPIKSWILLQQQLPLINLNIQFASGTVGVDILQGVEPVYDGSFFSTGSVPQYGFDFPSNENNFADAFICDGEGGGGYKVGAGGGSESSEHYGSVSLENDGGLFPSNWHIPTKYESQ